MENEPQVVELLSDLVRIMLRIEAKLDIGLRALGVKAEALDAAGTLGHQMAKKAARRHTKHTEEAA